MPAATPATQSRLTLKNRPKAGIDTDISSGNGTFLLEKNVKIPRPDELSDKECLIKVEWLSLDPAMRGWLNDSRSYIPPVQIGAVMRAGGVGTVAALPNNYSGKLKIGDWISCTPGWQEYASVPLKECIKLNIGPKSSPTWYLGALGMPGQTAYWGIFDVAKIKSGETVVVSGAAGAVGSIVCQLAKLKGCKVIAIAGGADKCKFLKDELNVDAALDYKDKDFKQSFRKTVGYLDVYFDNVGGEILDLALTRLKKGARIALCGAISAYNDPSPKGIQMYLNLISQRAKIEGFIVFDYADRYHIAEKEMAEWISSGQLKVRETRLIGLDKCVQGLTGLFKGENTGKLLVKVGKDDAKL